MGHPALCGLRCGEGLFFEDALVGGQGQELDELRGADELAHEVGGFFVGSVARGVDSRFLLGQLIGDDALDERFIDCPAIGEFGFLMHPLPKLGAADLGGGCVFHQIEERNAADAAQPCLDVAETDGDILFEAGFSDLALGNLEQVGGSGVVIGQLLCKSDWAGA